MTTKQDEITEAVVDLLAHLGDDKDAVATSLRAHGIKGQRDDVCGCPVANFLAENGVTKPEVDRHAVALDAYEHPDGIDGPVRVLLPDAVQDFLASFDDGWYPDLDEAGEREATA